jgi:hypothetical protein
VGIKVSPSHAAFKERLSGGASEVEGEVRRWDDGDVRILNEKRVFAGAVDTSRYWLEGGRSLALGHELARTF